MHLHEILHLCSSKGLVHCIIDRCQSSNLTTACQLMSENWKKNSSAGIAHEIFYKLFKLWQWISAKLYTQKPVLLWILFVSTSPVGQLQLWLWMENTAVIHDIKNKKHLKNVGPIHHCEPPHAHSADVASGTVACCLRIVVHDDNDNTWQRGPLWPHGMGPMMITTNACSSRGMERAFSCICEWRELLTLSASK